MADYGVKYQCTFDPIGPLSATPVYKIEILEKDYDGLITDVIGSAVPVIHRWDTDDPKAPVKGSSLTVSLVNVNGSLPLSTFFSTDDDHFQIKFWWLTELKFIGFLVQDDCSEILVDFTHEISLSANDNLGLLKEVPLDKAKIVYDIIDTTTDTWSLTAPHTLTLPAGIAASVHTGDVIQIHNVIFDVTYHVNWANGGVDMTVSETVATGSPGGSDDIEVLHPRAFDDKVTLAFILENCLWATGLEINTEIWGQITEVTQNTTTSFIDQTLIDPRTFLKDESIYDDCYSVLEQLMARFKMTIFQAKGVWNIIRWDELRYGSNVLPVYVYDADFEIDGSDTADAVYTIGIGEQTQAETGLIQKILRPFLSVKETFNYKQPGDLLRNANLQQLGNLLNTSTTGSGVDLQTSREYEVLWWTYTDAFPTASGVNGPAEFFIRVISDSFENEIERYLVLKNNGIHSYRVEANAGDTFTYSFSFRTPGLNSDGAVFVLIVQLDDGITVEYACESGDVAAVEPGWKAGIGFNTAIGGDTQSNFNTVSITSQRVPYDGLLTFYLLPFNTPVSDETQYKDIRLEYNFNINESTKIIGHTHQTSQIAVIKNAEDEEIFIDSSPRNSIAGTLFLDSSTGLVQDKTTRWEHPYLAQSLLLGDLITFEQLFWRRLPRTILEGSFYGLLSFANHVSMLSIFKYTYFPDLNFVAGTMEIDYRNNKFSGTLWEIWNDNETDADLSETYEFKYLYSTQ